MNKNVLSEERSIKDLVDRIREGVPEPSPFLYTKIRARLKEPRRVEGVQRWWKWIAAPVLAFILVGVITVLPLMQDSKSTNETAISLTDLEEYVLSHPDMLYGYIADPNEQNAYALYVSFYEFAQENSVGTDVSEIYDHYRYLTSNAEFFL